MPTRPLPLCYSLHMAKTRYWLMKSEADCYSIDDLKRDKRTFWDGVRNYQARNFMRDDMRVGDLVLFHHSNGDPPGVAGIAKVCKAAYPDHTALDPDEQHYDPKASEDNPIWMMVDIEHVETFPQVVPLAELREMDELDGMLLLKRGQRLSVMPVEPEHFKIVRKMGKSRKAPV
jgi:predicted RNA-binding protein with PUA-like domain